MANAITAFRLLLIPVFIVLMSFHPRFSTLAAGVFIFAVLTDWLDGWVARSFGKVTDFGKLFDPLVDRLLIIAALIMIFLKLHDVLPLWALILIVIRELVLVAGYKYLQKRDRKMSVTYFGKVATAVLFGSLMLLFLGLISFGTAIFYLGLFLYIISAVDYIIKGIKRLKQPTTS